MPSNKKLLKNRAKIGYFLKQVFYMVFDLFTQYYLFLCANMNTKPFFYTVIKSSKNAKTTKNAPKQAF